MIEKLKYQFSIADYRKVIKIADDLVDQEPYKTDCTFLMYKAAAYANLMEDENAISSYEIIIELHPTKVLPRIRLA